MDLAGDDLACELHKERPVGDQPMLQAIGALQTNLQSTDSWRASRYRHRCRRSVLQVENHPLVAGSACRLDWPDPVDDRPVLMRRAPGGGEGLAADPFAQIDRLHVPQVVSVEGVASRYPVGVESTEAGGINNVSRHG